MRLILAYKNFAANRAVSHIGLGVTALNAVKTFRANSIRADVWPITNSGDLRSQLAAARDAEPTHVVVSAPWIPTVEMAQLCADFPETRFAVNCHSNLGFLQADPSAMRLVREGIELERCNWNFSVAANCTRLANWVKSAYGAPCLCLPNIYYLGPRCAPRPRWQAGTLRIGAFGATRALKNLLTAAGGAIGVANSLRADLEFWISSGRNEGAGPVLEAVRQMFHGVPHVRLVENNWQSWPQFRQTVRHMHLLLQPSYTESFNVVTADGVAEGVASVVSDAIEWAPASWKAKVDDAQDIARVGVRLLRSPFAVRRGHSALEAHNKRSLTAWRAFLR